MVIALSWTFCLHLCVQLSLLLWNPSCCNPYGFNVVNMLSLCAYCNLYDLTPFCSQLWSLFGEADHNWGPLWIFVRLLTNLIRHWCCFRFRCYRLFPGLDRVTSSLRSFLAPGCDSVIVTLKKIHPTATLSNFFEEWHREELERGPGEREGETSERQTQTQTQTDRERERESTR